MGLNLRSSLNHFRQGLLHFWIGSAAIGFRILFLIPEADPDRCQSLRGDQGDFVLEAFLFSHQGNDFVLNDVRVNSSNVLGLDVWKRFEQTWGPPWISPKRCDCRLPDLVQMTWKVGVEGLISLTIIS